MKSMGSLIRCVLIFALIGMLMACQKCIDEKAAEIVNQHGGLKAIVNRCGCEYEGGFWTSVHILRATEERTCTKGESLGYFVAPLDYPVTNLRWIDGETFEAKNPGFPRGEWPYEYYPVPEGQREFKFVFPQ